MCRINKPWGLFNVHLLFNKTIQKCTFNIEKTLKSLKEAKASVICMTSSRVTGAKVSSKSILSIWV